MATLRFYNPGLELRHNWIFLLTCDSNKNSVNGEKENQTSLRQCKGVQFHLKTMWRNGFPGKLKKSIHIYKHPNTPQPFAWDPTSKWRKISEKILLLKVEDNGISVSSLTPSQRFPVASPGDLGARKDYRGMGKVLVKGQLAGGLFMGGVGLGAVPLTLGVTIVTFHHLSVGWEEQI